MAKYQSEVAPMAEHAFEQLFLHAFSSQPEVLNYVRTQTLKQERSRLDSIIADWRRVRSRVQQVIQAEAGLAETIRVGPTPSEHATRLQAIADDPLFQKGFPGAGFALVEIDKLVAGQRTVHLGYVDRLKAKFSKTPTLAELIEICVSPRREMEAIQHLEIGQNTHVFSSPNSDIRFLGAYEKQLTDDDLRYAEGGGLPAAAIVAFVGYGSASISVYRFQRRVILGNGFHRVYALRSLGVTEIPVVLQDIQNPAIEFPPAIGMPREYLLQTPRPTLLKDFFDPEFVVRLKVQERIKTVVFQIVPGQHDVPV